MSLVRFTEAQDHVWPRALEEIQNGRKESHWMWFVFPQLRGLGRSPTAQHYGISDLDEARAYLAHPVLGPRLREVSRSMLEHAGTPPEVILGSIDAMKLRSCATLFQAMGEAPEFSRLLDVFYNGQPCELTLRLIAQ